ncbi:MAG TPA: 5'-3' exonuclease H3TH domain-containing protein [Oscillospiraceae bacterium]|nr:5'-3' exonuclease H3TH domain-containing protein [Oscillospiraceae bacterium]HPF56113.1 5'-3' exonuclease H3TH domain-containing protein [Clostridiales bacterium]HPK34353.1 5'-3' exonuclease H3TH domain-containing protein [Oscillospiraceae bacterium]HPR75132.1 5'-3' exonuclease H3TH domain-containing protein [Oscillospiraceae bacterium]
MDKLLIVDGHNLLFQMFFGMPSRIVNKDGKTIQGTLGFVGALLKIIRMVQPTHLVVLFDGEHENFRSELDAEYKANRQDYSIVDEMDNPFSQLSDIYNALDYMNIQHTEIAEFETDDVIASYAITYGTDMQIVISSFDSDFFQLINDNVFLLRYRGDKSVVCGCEYIRDRLDIAPDQYSDFKSLVGDASDNIKGADKIGPKTAAFLLNRFGTLDRILENADQINKPSIQASIIQNNERLLTNRKLIKLDGRANIPFELAELEYQYNGVVTNDVLIGIGLR